MTLQLIRLLQKGVPPPYPIINIQVKCFHKNFQLHEYEIETVKWLHCFFGDDVHLCTSSPDALWVNTGTTTASAAASWYPCRWTRRSSSPVWWGACVWCAPSSASWFSSTRSAPATGRPLPWCKCQCCQLCLVVVVSPLPPPSSWLVMCCEPALSRPALPPRRHTLAPYAFENTLRVNPVFENDDGVLTQVSTLPYASSSASSQSQQSEPEHFASIENIHLSIEVHQRPDD